ncbi:MAG: histidine kinase, partial [Bacteroidetes bacterium]|nr:histidine kinase [Bacteroidota bacterium]
MRLSKRIKEYHFEFKHLTVLFIVLISFQLVITLINKNSVNTLLSETRDWYQKDSAENLANLTTTSLELIIESVVSKEQLNIETERKVIQSFDIILSQQKLQHNLEEICILINHGDEIILIDNGKELFEVLLKDSKKISPVQKSQRRVIEMYKEFKNSIAESEQIHSKLINNEFNIFVPLVINGEFIGVVYMKNSTDFSFITDQIIAT